MIFKGYIIALLELLGFGLISHHIKDAVELNQKVLFVSEGQFMKPINVNDFINSSDKRIRDYIGL